MKLSPRDLDDIRWAFESALKRMRGIEKAELIRMKSRIDRELTYILTWRNPTAQVILNRWENRLPGVFRVLPDSFRDELKDLVSEKIANMKRRLR